MTGLRLRRLGRTHLMVTELGLGAMDTSTSSEGQATVEAAVDAGINFVDSAREYAGSEFLLGQVVRARGAKPFHIGTKTFSHNIDGSQRDVDRSLSMLGVDRIDLYQLHDISTQAAWDEARDEDTGALAGLQIAKYRGLIGHIGVSSHNLDLLPVLITSGAFDAVMLEYSAFFPQTAELIDLAARHDVGVIVMRPLGGSGRTSVMRGRIAEGYDGLLTPANLLRYVLSHPGVSTAIPGARYPSRIHDNVRVASDYTPMTDGERGAIEAEARELY
ncbi:MAG: aldo/keto reductase [Dehalococcoidia bacterium]|nr:aldo/keto reductase [Dehalococcoidia bacterium]